MEISAIWKRNHAAIYPKTLVVLTVNQREVPWKNLLICNVVLKVNPKEGLWTRLRKGLSTVPRGPRNLVVGPLALEEEQGAPGMPNP